MAESVMVRISGEETVRYSQTKQMPKDEFERLSKMLNSESRSDRRKAEALIGGLWIDRRDPMDVPDFEIENFEIAAEFRP